MPAERKKNLLLAISSGELGGGEETVRLLAQCLDQNRFRISVACPDSPLSQKIKQIPGIQLFPMEFPTIPSPVQVNRLARILRHERIDVLHTHLFHGDLYGFLATRIVSVRLLVSTIQGINFFWETADPARKSRWRVTSSFYRWIYRSFDRMAACSQAVKEAVCSRPGIKIKPEKIRVIHNSIDVRQVQTGAHQGTAEELWPISSNGHAAPKRIITVANFAPFKGHRVLVEALSLLEPALDFQCMLIGDGPERPAVESYIQSAGLSNRVKILGRRTDIPALIRGSDLFVLPSLWEPFGISVLEAMSLGIPVVACAAGGIPEILTNEENGLLVPPGNASALAEGIRKILTDASLSKKIVPKALERVADFNAGIMVKAYERLYQEALEKTP